MLGKLSHWLSMKLEEKGDDFLGMRCDALTRMKKATLEVLETVQARQSQLEQSEEYANYISNLEANVEEKSIDTKPKVVLTQDDLCVHELCLALESCLKLGLKHQSDKDISWWNVLYSSTLIVDEPTLVQSILTAALLAETDIGKERCWMKLALNNRTLETSLMIIFSVSCEELIRSSYEEWSIVRCSEGLGIFLQMVIEIREVQFSIEVNDSAFRAPDETNSLVAEMETDTVSNSADVIETMDGASAADVVVSTDKLSTAGETSIQEEEEVVETSSVNFPHRHKGIKPWQHVFGVSISYLSKNPYHSRFALIDPVLAIPNIVQDCIDVLMANPDTPRLFRATVLSVHLNQLREIVESDGALPPDIDAHGAGALLMDFFKHLREPLLTSEKYDAFVASGRIRDEEASIRNITCLVQDLPVYCKFTLEKVIGLMHFLQLPEHAQHNGVDVIVGSAALAPVIAFKIEPVEALPPGHRRNSTHSQYQDVRYAAVGAQVVERMIKHYDVIFQDVRLKVSDALERLQTKKEMLLSIYQLFKMKPQVNFMSDRQQLEEITNLFAESVKSESANNPAIVIPTLNTESSPPQQRASLPHILVSITPPAPLLNATSRTASGTNIHNPAAFRTASGTSTRIGVSGRRQTVATSSPQITPASASTSICPLDNPLERSLVDLWERHGFNRPTVLGNFDKGGVLLLRCVSYMLKHDTDALHRLYLRALPSTTSAYDAGLVAAAICKSLIHMLKLIPSPEHPNINIVSLSTEPFWEIFDEEGYFFKLFVLMFQIFDQIWGSLNPEEASFTRVFCDTEAKLDDLLKNSPSSVDDVRAEWENIWKELTDVHDDVEEPTSTDDEASSSIGLPESPSRVNKRTSFLYKPEDYETKLMNPSNILTTEHVAYIDHNLPITSQLCRWCLLYSTEAHGSSLHTLLMLTKNQSPTIIVIKDDQGNVFGGYGSDAWHHATQYYGNGETFLFTFSHSTAGFMKYPWSRRNSYFMLCSEESLIMGGGGSFGLYLDNDLASGTTGACETFSSRPLVSSHEFNCVCVEVWGFTTGDSPTISGERRKKSVLD